MKRLESGVPLTTFERILAAATIIVFAMAMLGSLVALVLAG